MVRITEQILATIYPNSKAADRARYLAPLELAMTRYGITTPNRVRAFLAQVGHESGQLSRTTENLNYSESGLLSVFGKYFDSQTAKLYARQPERIANKVYANRLGNGSVESGDGWRYRGRGLIQLTGKANYEEATRRMYALPMGVDFVQEPDLLAGAEYASQSAAWYWESRGLNGLADLLDEPNWQAVFREITRKINGGFNGLDDRMSIFGRAKNVIR